MTNETRKITDDQIKEAFKQTKRTHDLVIESIEYRHYEDFPDWYLVRTDKGAYHYEYTHTYNRDIRRAEYYYHRIVKIPDSHMKYFN